MDPREIRLDPSIAIHGGQIRPRGPYHPTMHRYIIARVAAACDTAPASLPASPTAEIVLVEFVVVVNRRTFFQTCFHTARNVPRRPPATIASLAQ